MTSANTDIKRRKGRHLDVCINSPGSIESPHSYFGDIRLVHHPLPELDCDMIDTSTTFLEHPLSRPFFISCMTGGSEAGARINRHLVQAAQQTGIPVGLGSMRVLLQNPELFGQFHVKPLAPDVPIWANLSAAQLQHLSAETLVEWLKRLEVQALVLHCNVGQEQVQPEGDRCFSGMLQRIQQLCETSPVPIIIKETGFGLRPQDVTSLAYAGVAALDIAGAGGTNWILVESLCCPRPQATMAQDFADWGNPTPIVLAAMPHNYVPILASGGIRNGVDVAKSLALGATLAGLALPFVQSESSGGLDGVLELIETLTQSLKTAMLMTGNRSIADLSHTGLILSDPFISQVRQYKQPEQWRDLLRSRP